FGPNIDGYFLPEPVEAIYAAGRQSHIPLLAGWNADEGSYREFFGKDEPTAQNFAAKARARFGEQSEAFLKLYPGATDAEARRSAQDLAGDQFIAFSTWKWMEMQQQTAGARIYRYEFDQAPPLAPGAPAGEAGAYHSAEIEFVFGVLSSKALPWRPEDHKLSGLMSTYWANFAKSGDPNGPGLPPWPVYVTQEGYPVLHLSANPHAEPDRNRGRYEFLDSLKPVK
ncbi:MAG TPA: carboxylesterase family protein, partial [Bryobacteraceae bacterium]